MTWEMGDKALHYYEKHKDRPARQFVVNASALITERPALALDLGAGQMTESKHLLGQGFATHAVDINPDVRKYAEGLLASPDFSLTVCDFRDLNLPDASLNLVVSQFALQFISKENLGTLTDKIRTWLKPYGLFVANVLGTGDLWNDGRNTDMSFFEKKELAKFLERNFEVTYLTEHYSNEPTAAGKSKNWWHYFNFIAQKPQ